MRLIGIWLVLLGAAGIASAQTNSGASTNNPQAMYAPEEPQVQTNSPANVRKLSLQDCIELALKHNLDLQIDRINPAISYYAVEAGYGAYDPTFSMSGAHDHNETGRQLLAGGFEIPGSVSDDNRFSSSLSGLLPWGTTYSIGTGNPIRDTYGSSGTLVNVLTNPLAFQTNTSVLITTNGLIPTTTLITNYAKAPGISRFENSSGSVQITATQPLLKNFWINSSILTIKVAKNRLKYSSENLRLQLMTEITLLEQAYYDLIYARESVIVQQKALEADSRQAMENKKKLEVGTMAPLDLQSAEAQVAQDRAALLQAQSQEGTQERVVKQLITENYREWAAMELVPSEPFSSARPYLNLQDSWSRGLEKRPDLMLARLDIERAGIQLKYDKNQLLPQLDVFGTFGYNGSGKEFSDALYDIQQHTEQFYSYGGQISLPLSNVGARNSYRSDKAAMEQLVLQFKKLQEQIMIEIDNDVGTVRANYDQVQATKAYREYEEASVQAEQKKLESGKSTTYLVILQQRDLTTARGKEIQALDNFNKSLSQLSLHEGTTLERLGIKFEVK